GRGALRRSGRGAARRKAPDGRRRRQCGALPAAVDRQRGGNRGERDASRARLCRVVSQSVEAGGSAMSTSLRHFLDIDALPLGELRAMLAAGAAMKAKLKAHDAGRKPLAGKT